MQTLSQHRRDFLTQGVPQTGTSPLRTADIDFRRLVSDSSHGLVAEGHVGVLVELGLVLLHHTNVGIGGRHRDALLCVVTLNADEIRDTTNCLLTLGDEVFEKDQQNRVRVLLGRTVPTTDVGPVRSTAMIQQNLHKVAESNLLGGKEPIKQKIVKTHKQIMGFSDDGDVLRRKRFGAWELCFWDLVPTKVSLEASRIGNLVRI
mmetsp:Transcript_65918/g.155716  ORF Transcript_65918/g.155716 Transcript_65918/m.155716 type:complete len:204 (+) Transcript_65918:189-800(+)